MEVPLDHHRPTTGTLTVALVQVKARNPASGSELAFAVDDGATVDRLHEQWLQESITVIQPPQHMDFGYTFTASDPDGHHLRVFCPSGD
jgi:predicted lactoylglutathione lyase